MKKHPDTNAYMQNVFPEWYWEKGLCDAHIRKITAQEFNYDPVMHGCIEGNEHLACEGTEKGVQIWIFFVQKKSLNAWLMGSIR